MARVSHAVAVRIAEKRQPECSTFDATGEEHVRETVAVDIAGVEEVPAEKLSDAITSEGTKLLSVLAADDRDTPDVAAPTVECPRRRPDHELGQTVAGGVVEKRDLLPERIAGLRTGANEDVLRVAAWPASSDDHVSHVRRNIACRTPRR